MTEYCAGCGEWDLPDGTTTCTVCDEEFCPDCFDGDVCHACQESSDE